MDRRVGALDDRGTGCQWVGRFAWIGVLAALSLGVGKATAADPLVIESGAYRDATAARAVWEPMRGSPPVGVANLEGRAALQLSCQFAGNPVERVSWDRRVQLDLSGCAGVQFDVFCRDAAPVSYFSLYFQSGEGWYHASFYPESSTAWNTIRIDKASVTAEGRPAGWHQVRALRLSAWKAGETNTEFYVSHLRMTGVLGIDAPIAVLRADSVAQHSPEEARSVQQYHESIVQSFQAMEIGAATLSDLGVSAERLRPAKLVVLPYNPSLPPDTARALDRYVGAGGRLLVFYLVPESLRGWLGVDGGAHVKAPRPDAFAAIRWVEGALPEAPRVIQQRSWNLSGFRPIPGKGRVLAEWADAQGRPSGHPAVLGSDAGLVMTHVLLSDDLPNKRKMLLAMAAHLAPDLWPVAVDGSLARVGRLSRFGSLEALAAWFQAVPPRDARAIEAMDRAKQLREQARVSGAERQFGTALEQADQARQQALEAFCRAQQPEAGEFRGFWCHSAYGVEGMNWDGAARLLAENGFTAVVPNMLWGGVAFYPSQVLPVAPPVKERGDAVAECLAACRKHGVQVHVWKVNWNLGQAAPAEFVARLRAAGRLQQNARGQEERWLCPSHPDNRQLEIASMVEVARLYAVDGLHFDYIRYPDGDHCYCAGCRERFQREVGAASDAWPQSVLPGGRQRAAWLDWRRAQITAVVKAVREEAHQVRPGIRVSAAVFPNWNTDRDTIGQDWKAWCDAGYLDFVCPMDYTPSNRNLENLVVRQLGWAGRVPCYPGLGPSATSPALGADRVIDQINITRAHRTGGFMVFNYGVAESRDLLPRLGLGITARP